MRRTISTALAVLVVLGASALAQAPPEGQGPGIRDQAGMFSAQAVKKAEQVLREVEDSEHLQVLIETHDTFGDRQPREVAVDNAKKANIRGLSVAISKKEHKLDIEASESARRVFTKGELELVKEAFTRSFRKSENDEGLLNAVAEIRRAAMKVGVRDHAKLFSPEAVKEADEILETARHKTPWGAVIETVETLGDKSLRETAIEKARAAQVHGLYVLIAKKEHKIYAQPSESAAKVFPPEKARALENTISAAFKKNAFDTGLRDAVAAIRQDSEAVTGSSAVSDLKPSPLARKAESAGQDVPKAPAPIDPGVVKSEGVTTTMILLGGGALLLVLWLMTRRSRSPQPLPQSLPPNAMTDRGPGPRPAPGAGYPPGSRPGVPPGYAPQQPGSGPGYGYTPPPPGYGQGGYGAPMPPPQQGGGGGGFITGALGGAAGAIAGNILYDKFGRPHESQGPVPTQGSVFPHQSSHPLDPDANIGSGPPSEDYDPNAGVGADWGTNAPEGHAPEVDQAGLGGDWGGGAEEPAETGGDWGGGTDEPAETGGDWGGGSDEPAETGGDWGGGTDDQGGGDWGGGADDQDSGDTGDTEEQGGSW